MLRDLSDGFLENPAEHFTLGKLVHAKVKKVDYLTGFVQLSFKKSEVSDSGSEEIKKLKEGQVVMGKVQRVTNIGVFIEIENTNLVGLSRKAFALSDKGSQLSDEYDVGDIVKAKILSVSIESKKVSLGLLTSFFDDSQLPLGEQPSQEEVDEVEESAENSENESEPEQVGAKVQIVNATILLIELIDCSLTSSWLAKREKQTLLLQIA